MASATATPPKNLGEFLKEQQEPFILDLYLSERGYSTPKRTTPNGSERWAISSVLNKRRQNPFPFSKLLTTLHKKLALHNQTCILVRDTNSDFINQHVDDVKNVDVSVPRETSSTEDQAIEETDRFSFSTATSSTVYNSCSDFDEESPHTTSQASTLHNISKLAGYRHEKHHQRCLEGSPVPQSQQNIYVTRENQEVSGMGQRMSNCCVVPKKISEESLLSAAIWSSLIQSTKREKCSKELRELLMPNPNVFHVLKSKTLLHKAKQLLFHCVREIAMNVCRKEDRQQGYKGLREPGELGKIIWKRTTKELGGNETNLSLDSMDEWSEFKPQVRRICIGIGDAILERVICEIVSEMIEILPPTLW